MKPPIMRPSRPEFALSICAALTCFAPATYAQFTYTTQSDGLTITGYTSAQPDVVIPPAIGDKEVVRIADDAFYATADISTISIPQTIKTIGGRAFGYCSKLQQITVAPENTAYKSVDGVLFDKAMSVLIQFPSGRPGTVTVPAGVTLIENQAFAGSTKITDVTIPFGTLSIGEYAFGNCIGLKSITLPNSVTTIGNTAFSNCKSLDTIQIPKSVKTIGRYAFTYCGLTSINIPSGVTNLGDAAFAYCQNLVSVTLPSTISSIGVYTFLSCSGLRFVYFDGNCPRVGSDAFANAGQMIVFYLPGTTGWGATFSGKPTALWNPTVLTGDSSFGVQTGLFGFRVAGSDGLKVVVEACTSPAFSDWLPVTTNTISGGWFYFNDPDWIKYPQRVYRFRSP